MATKINVEGGTIEPCQPFQVLGDKGLETAYRWSATSSHLGITEVFATQGGAEWWLWLINEYTLGRQYRESMTATEA